jgi:hypothetical protein
VGGRDKKMGDAMWQLNLQGKRMSESSKTQPGHPRPHRRMVDPIGKALGTALASGITMMIAHPSEAHLWTVMALAALAWAYSQRRKASTGVSAPQQ